MQIEPRALLVVGAHDMPRRKVGVGRLQHQVPGARVIVPALARRKVHIAELPLPHGILDARFETPLLLLVADLEPKFDQSDAVVDDVLFEVGADFQEALVLLLGAEAHDIFDAGAVVPAAVEDHDLAGRREVREITLHVHLRFFPIGRGRQGDEAECARANPLGHRADRSALAGGVAAFEHDDDALRRSA